MFSNQSVFEKIEMSVCSHEAGKLELWKLERDVGSIRVDIS